MNKSTFLFLVCCGFGYFFFIRGQKVSLGIKPDKTGYQLVKSPEDAMKAYPKTVADIDAQYKEVTTVTDDAINKICNLTVSDYSKESVLYALDKAYAYMSSFAGTVSLLSMVHPDKEIRDAATSASNKIEEFSIDVISSNKKLYTVLKNYADTSAAHDKLTSEESLFLSDLLEDFKRSGMALSENDFQKVVALKKQLVTLTSQFDITISQDTTTVLVNKDELAGLSDDLIARLKQNETGSYELRLDYPTQDMIMRECSVSQTRKKYYEAFNRKAYPANLSVLQQVVSCRDQLAKLVGYPSFAHLDLADQMINTPEKARKIQEDLLPAFRAKAHEEIKMLLKDLPEGVKTNSAGKMYPWDLGYTQSYYKKKYYDIDELQLAQYFPLEQTMDQLFDIYQKFFDLSFKKISCSKMWHPDVELIQVSKQDGTVIGYVFTDLFPRENKYGHAAKFSGIASRKGLNGEYYPAVCALVCNFTKPTSDTPSLLRYDEVNTFFHEFGHALHCLLGATQLACQSGTAVKRDFVETPSQMLENWLQDASIVQQLGKHYKTGQSIPEALVTKKLESLKIFTGLMESRQVMLGMISLDVHLGGSKKDFDALLKHHNETAVPDLVFWGANKMYCSFGHLMGYGAKYYGYLWSRILGADIFAQIEQEGLLSPEAGKRYAQGILIPGGSRDPYAMVCDYLKREPKQDAFLKKQGF